MPNPYKAKSKAKVQDLPRVALELDVESGPERETELPKAQSTEEVPVGTMKEIYTWVDGNAEKARAALDAEKASDRPRPSLISGLEQIANS